jgi:hypothetical protein
MITAPPNTTTKGTDMRLCIELDDYEVISLRGQLSDAHIANSRALDIYEEDRHRCPNVRYERMLYLDKDTLEKVLKALDTEQEKETSMDFYEWFEMVTTQPGFNPLDNLEVEAASIQNLGSNASLERLQWWWKQLTEHAKRCLLYPAYKRGEYAEEYEEMMLQRRMDDEGEARAEAQSYADEFGYHD